MKHSSIFSNSVFVIDNQLTTPFCSHLINKFEEDLDGHTYGMVQDGHIPTIKQSTDLHITNGTTKHLWLAEDRELNEALKNAIIRYDEHLVSKVKAMENINIFAEMFDTGHQMQRTSPGGFYNWHSDSCDTRLLTYIFYLNDVKGGGGYTEFCDGTKIHPKAGRMLIFPATWQYIHRGVAPKKDIKYIVTGWLHSKLTGNNKVLEMSGICTLA